MSLVKDKYIDLKEVIRKKNPQLVRWMPEFILSYIKKVLREDSINEFMARRGDLQGLEFLAKVIEDFGIEVECIGEENIPRIQPVIFAANHPLGGMDGIVFMHVLGKYRQDIKFLVNDVLLNLKNLENLFVPVNKHGSQRRSGQSGIEATYAGTDAVLVFPAGLVSRKQKNGIMDLEWKKSFINKAKKYEKDIVPVYIEGRNSNFFYNFARLRTWLGIKTNIEMFYLPGEMFDQKGKKVRIHIGKPISYQYFDGSKSEKEWAEYMKQQVYSLAPRH